MQHERSRLAVRIGFLLAGIASVTGFAGAAGNPAPRPVPGHVAALRTPAPLSGTRAIPSVLDPSLRHASGVKRVIVRLKGPSLAEGGSSVAAIRAEQDALFARLKAVAPSVQRTSSVQVVLNAMFLRADARELPAIALDSGVGRVAPVGDYKRSDLVVVPYVGAKTVQGLGFTGKGVKVAVLDTGIDYTHEALGGAGTAAAYTAAYGTAWNDPRNTVATPGVFPTKKVIGGYDFVGEEWPNGPEGLNGPINPDPNPISSPDTAADSYCAGLVAAPCPGVGHGTHVADIIAGKLGMAPDAKLYAFKVCASYADSCNGEAIMLGIEAAADPHRDGTLRDRADVINLSLGGAFGQPYDDDASAAIDHASVLGILTVAAAGNEGDVPYIVGTPGAAASALAVGGTALPIDSLQLASFGTGGGATTDPVVYDAWSPAISARVAGKVTYPSSNRLACDPFPAHSLHGIVLVDRGSCSASVKAANASAAGASLVLIGLVAPGAPFAFSYGGGTVTAPTFTIAQADADLIRNGTASAFAIDPANTLPLTRSMVSYSSRGPAAQGNFIKPEIVAPVGDTGIISASAGSGTGTRAYAGTSFSTPIVAGAAALLKSARPNLTVMEYKHLLVGTADIHVAAPSVQGGLVPDIQAPVSRTGGGELRIDKAVVAPIILSVEEDYGQGGLGFGFVTAADPETVRTKTLRITNVSSKTLTLNVKALLADNGIHDAASHAVHVNVPSTITSPAHSFILMPVTITVDGASLRTNLMNSGSLGNSSPSLTGMEYGGYIAFSTQDGARYTIPWHVLPRQSARVRSAVQTLQFNSSGIASVNLQNTGVGTAQYQTYSLLGTGPQLPPGPRGAGAPNPSVRAFGIATYPDSADCSSGFLFDFAVTNWKLTTVPQALTNTVLVDTDDQGVDFFGNGQHYNYAIVNGDLSQLTGAPSPDGRELALVVNLVTGQYTANFFIGHPTNATNMDFLVCGEQLGLAAGDASTRSLHVLATVQDGFTGNYDGALGPYTVVPFGDRYQAIVNDTPGNSSSVMTVYDFGPALNPQDSGVLLYSNGARSPTNNGGASPDSEAIVIPAKSQTGH